MKRNILIAGFIICTLASCGQKAHVSCNLVDPLLKFFPESSAFREMTDTLDAASNTHVEFQFALRSDSEVKDFTVECSTFKGPDGIEIPAPRCGVVGYVGVGECAPDPAYDVLKSPSGLFPDPILEQDSYDFDPFHTFCPWITAHVPAETPEGVYTATVTMSGKANGRRFRFTDEIHIKVWGVTMKDPDFPNVNWAFDFDNCMELWNGGEPVERYSPLHDEYLDQLFSILAEAHQTVTRIPIFNFVEMEKGDDGKWTFDFARFDEWIRRCEEKGILQIAQGEELGHRLVPQWTAPMGLFVPIEQDGKQIKETFPIDAPEVRDFYSSFIPALKSHLEEIGWADRYYQQICDEPIDDNAGSYNEAVALIREFWPDIKVLEACQTTKCTGSIDAWCPQLNYWHENYDFYKERQAKGDEVWYYTCCFPKGPYPNRFIEQPSLKTRLLYCMGFKYNADGYIHWGFNYWNEDPYYETTAAGTGTMLPGGDCWIVYPGDRKFLRSIRFEQIRDGLEDFALLQMLAEKDEGSAKWLVDTLITNWWMYTGNPDVYRATKRDLLKALSE